MKKALLVIFCIGCIECFGQSGIYWAETGKIRRADLDGTNATTLVAVFYPRGVAVDTAGGKIYWTDIGTKKIQRANLDGSNVQDLVDSLSKPYDIALDVQGGKMYWTDYGTKKVQRANFDGTNTEDLVTGLSKPLGIDVDVTESKVYWIDNGNTTLRRSNLDGTNIETLITEITGIAFETPVGIALDLFNRKIFWNEDGKVWVTDTLANPVGTFTVMGGTINGTYYPKYIGLDIGAQKLYITDSITYRIVRMDFDGLNAEDLSWTIGFTPSPQGIAVIGDIAIGVDEPIVENVSVSVYPNPASGVLMVEILKQVQNDISMFEMYDITGRLIHQYSINNNQSTIDVSELAKGLYVWSIGTARGKVVVE